MLNQQTFTMCNFTVELALCPCTQGRTDHIEDQCVRFRKPTEKRLPLGGTRHALDVQDGMGLAIEWTCPLEREKSGKGAKANLACPNVKWSLAMPTVTLAMIRSFPCAECLAGCNRAWGQ